MTTTLDKFGRVMIPKQLRKQLGITPQTTLHIEEDGKRIIIEPVQEEALIDKDGILVFTGKFQKEVIPSLAEDRKDRISKLLTGEK